MNNSPSDLLDRSIILENMPEDNKQWWLGLPDELQKDIEFQE